jgi:hypothetical protein
MTANPYFTAHAAANHRYDLLAAADYARLARSAKGPARTPTTSARPWAGVVRRMFGKTSVTAATPAVGTR